MDVVVFVKARGVLEEQVYLTPVMSSNIVRYCIIWQT